MTTHFSNSEIEEVRKHAHSAQWVYPSEADGVSVPTGAGPDWTLGAITEIIPASTITEPFDIHHVNVESISGNGTYELVLYHGAGDDFAGRCRFTKSAVQDSQSGIPVLTAKGDHLLIPANDRIRAKLGHDDSAAGAESAVITVSGHGY